MVEPGVQKMFEYIRTESDGAQLLAIPRTDFARTFGTIKK